MNDNFSFFLNNFHNLEETFRNLLKNKFEEGKIDENNLRVHITNLFIIKKFNLILNIEQIY